MKLCYSPGSCSLAIHIVFREADVPHELAEVDLWQHKTVPNGDYFQINPRGTTPTLKFEGGLLTEGAAISRYLASRYVPTLVPANGTLERSRLHKMLNYPSSDYHKSFTPLFYLSPPNDPTAVQRPVLTKMTYLNNLLANSRPYILDDEFIVAGAHLLALTRQYPQFDISLAPLPILMDFMARITTYPAVRAALQAEGLEEHPNQCWALARYRFYAD